MRHADMIRRKQMNAVSQQIDLSKSSPERIQKMQDNNEEYFELLKTSKLFLNNQDFNVRVPFFAKNLILITASTGQGKSTAAANIAFHSLTAGQKVLMITNEEVVEDCYNRVTCLIKGWAYVDHKKFTTDQINTFNKYIKILEPRMKVIDDKYSSMEGGQTTTLEGIKSVLQSIEGNEANFDVVIIDYYQKIETSLEMPKLVDWQVQQNLANFLDNYKNNYLAPIVLMAQKKSNPDDKMSYKESIEGRKIILNAATCAIDVNADRDMKRTGWTLKKSRFSEFLDDTIYTGFKNGKYVPYTDEFKNLVEIEKQEAERNKMNRNIQPTNSLQSGN
jgi:hypothetical protein